MRHEIRKLQKEVGVTTLFVTHDRDEALMMADRIVVLDQARIEQIDTPENRTGVLVELPDRWVVVAGAGRCIGRAIAEAVTACKADPCRQPLTARREGTERGLRARRHR